PHNRLYTLSLHDALPISPFRGVRAQNVLTDAQHPKSLLVALNLRDRNAFDMYRVDLETGAITLEATNPGDVLTWKTDRNFVIRADRKSTRLNSSHVSISY